MLAVTRRRCAQNPKHLQRSATATARPLQQVLPGCRALDDAYAVALIAYLACSRMSVAESYIQGILLLIESKIM